MASAPITRDFNKSPKLLAVGSLLAPWAARRGDVVWGAGTWGAPIPPGLEIFAVRGPMTADHLVKNGYARPSVFGDPALLLPRFFPLPIGGAGIGYVPHHSERWEVERGLIDVRRPPLEVVAAIAACDLVISSSLHGVIVADAYRRPVVLTYGAEVQRHTFKYADYYASIGRPFPTSLWTYHDAARVAPALPPVLPDLDALLAAFPRERMQ